MWVDRGPEGTVSAAVVCWGLPWGRGTNVLSMRNSHAGCSMICAAPLNGNFRWIGLPFSVTPLIKIVHYYLHRLAVFQDFSQEPFPSPFVDAKA